MRRLVTSRLIWICTVCKHSLYREASVEGQGLQTVYIQMSRLIRAVSSGSAPFVFTCSFEGNCKLDPHTRKFCSGCRLKKCIEAGMKKQWILTDDQLAKRRRKGPSQGPMDSYDTTMEESPPATETLTQLTPPLPPMSQLHLTATPTPGPTPAPKLDMYSPTSCCEEVSTNYMSDETENSSHGAYTTGLNFSPPVLKMEPDAGDFPRPMSEEISKEIANLELEYQRVFDEGYSVMDTKRMTEKPHSANELFNMTDIFIRRLIKFSKHIPEFRQLKQEDQIHLLKGGIMEIMVLRSAMGFDLTNFQWKLKQTEDHKSHGLNPQMIQEQLGSGVYKDHLSFLTSLHQLTNSNKTIMTLLFVIELFSSDRPLIVNKLAVSAAQEKFSMWLQAYLESIMPVNEAKLIYPKLLMKLLDVRNLGESSAKLASNLDITKLEPLLIEVFSLQK